jgi:hypothetical protein
MVVVGSDKGYVYPFELMMDPKTKKKTFDPMIEGGKVPAFLLNPIERQC